MRNKGSGEGVVPGNEEEEVGSRGAVLGNGGRLPENEEDWNGKCASATGLVGAGPTMAVVPPEAVATAGMLKVQCLLLLRTAGT